MEATKNQTEAKQNKTKKTFSVKTTGLSLGVLLLGGAFLVLSIVAAALNGHNYKMVTAASADYLEAEQNISSIQSTTDYLSEMTRQAVNSGRAQYIQSYFEEVNNTNTIDRAVARLHRLMGNEYPEANSYLESAVMKEQAVIDQETHAMRLVVEANEIPLSRMPEEIQNYTLTETELNMTPEEQQQIAYDLINSDDHLALKKSYKDDLASAMDILMQDLQQSLDESQGKYSTSVLLMRISLICSFVIIFGIGVMIYSFFFVPIRKSVYAIRSDKKMPMTISAEMNYLGVAFNDLYDKNTNVKQHLKEQAERDSLTGLYNRTGFDHLCEMLKDSREPMAFMIIDVDLFKEVNDIYGHNIGDQALERVASMLRKCFRPEDYIVRYGGDEFIVFMMGVTPDQKDMIAYRINYMNECLKNPEIITFPAFSLSVGIAFVKGGYSDDLFAKADAALYQTKENGRGSYTFH